jgi:hypothetical protein
MRLDIRQALSYLKESGFDICERTYYRYKRKVESLKWERLLHIANLFTDQHLQRMDKLELVEQLMWKEYHQEKSPAKRVTILQAIVMMQPYLSGYYDATKYVISKRLKTDQIAKPEIGYLELKKFDKQEFNDEEQKEIRDMTPLS